MASRQTISEDWQDVADDNLSVISLESSRPLTPKPHDEREPEMKPENPFTDPPFPDEFNADEMAEAFDDDDTRNIDPQFLLTTLESLADILEDTICLEETNIVYTSNGRSPFAVCKRIREQVRELAPILSGYAKAMSLGSSADDIPLDPQLEGWLSSVRVKVLSLQVEAHNSLGRHSLGYKHEFERILQDLEEHEDKMEEFLPIWQVYFNEFQTQGMNLPIAPAVVPGPSDPYTTSRLLLGSAPTGIPSPTWHCPTTTSRSQSRPELTAKVPNLKKELYNLKDTISQVIERLHDTTSQGSEEQTSSSILTISTRLDNLHQTITIMNSNNGSEWIDSSLSGGMTHAEFRALDIYNIIFLKNQLREVFWLDGESQELRIPAHYQDMEERSDQLGKKKQKSKHVTKGMMSNLENLVENMEMVFGTQTPMTTNKTTKEKGKGKERAVERQREEESSQSGGSGGSHLQEREREAREGRARHPFEPQLFGGYMQNDW
ncbi:hypothetical protein QBC43DRAFT_327287 [Cladorrhinum sp. PSN259]|nr:hypothetical protein QBC43DRAFT_327287 [Cladorrhinum sp. PSN259]